MTNAQDPRLVRADVTGGIAAITLDSPHNANALSSRLLAELKAELEGAMADPAVRVVVLTGTGKVFCSGADLKEASVTPAAAAGGSGGSSPQVSRVPVMARVLRLLWDSPKPTICRVNGAARAGGIGLVAAADIAIATERATFAFSEVRVGVVPATISVPCLRRMPSRAAAEYFLTGEVFDAKRAAEIGLLTKAVPADDLDAETQRYADMLLRGAPKALAATKEILRDGQSDGLAVGFDACLTKMAELSASFFGSDEAREGMAAFAAKRDPSWVTVSPEG